MATNRDKINEMSNEELAKFMNELNNDNTCQFCAYGGMYGCEDCQDGILKWLNKECEEDK